MIDTIKNWLAGEIHKTLKNLEIDGDIKGFRVEVPPNRDFGDFSTNLAMVGAKVAKKPPRKLAAEISKQLEAYDFIKEVKIAGPGFINIFLTEAFYRKELLEILNQPNEEAFSLNYGKGKKIQLEFVSANPTGPLTVGHGRQAVIGDVLSSVYERFGFDVTREYYFNDAGKQMKMLSRSLWVRYNQLFDVENEIPEGGYRGEYIIELAETVKAQIGDQYVDQWNDEIEEFFLKKAKDAMFDHIKATLKKLDIHFDVYFSEGSLFEDGTVEKVRKLFTEKGYLYEDEGALWLKVSEFIDEKDKVLIRSDGMPTYFFTDIANHYKKHERGFDKVYNIWGADHHGHIPRMKAAMQALGFEEDFFNVILHQMVTLKKEGKEVKMSTRAGTFTTLNELIEMVGKSATRYFYAMVDKDGQLIFDIDLARSRSMDNPVFYVQYAHARICSLFDNAQEKGVAFNETENLDRLGSRDDNLMIRELLLYKDNLEEVIQTNSPHKLTNYLYELAALFHQYYNKNVFVDAQDPDLTNARLNLAFAVRKVLADGLNLLGVEAPQKMEQL